MRRVAVLVVLASSLFASTTSGATTAVVLGARSLAGVSLGASETRVVTALTRAIGAAPSLRRTADEVACGVTETATWDSLTVDMKRGTFVGYSDGPGGRSLKARTAAGLRVGESLASARVTYPRIATSFAQGGSYRVATPLGTLAGFLSAEPNSPRSTVASIGAGVQGCPAMSP